MNTDKIYAEQIANQYAEKETSKVKSLKRLDKKAKEPARIFALTFGIISSLVMGTGMSLAMGVIGGGTVLMTTLGIAVGCLGIVGASTNYFIYSSLLKKGKAKYKEDILELAKQISEENKD